MTETEFNELVDRTFDAIDDAIATSVINADVELTGGVMEIEFADQSKIILNRQAATQELWVAAKSGGYHYVWRDDAWRNTRDGAELFESLSGLISAQSGEIFAFPPGTATPES